MMNLKLEKVWVVEEDSVILKWMDFLRYLGEVNVSFVKKSNKHAEMESSEELRIPVTENSHREVMSLSVNSPQSA